MDRGSPCPMPLSISMGPKVNPSNLSVVIHPCNMFRMKFAILTGTRLLWRLCTSFEGTALGKAPSISRNNTDVTLPARHEVLMVPFKRCIASVVVRPGLPPKWLAGRRLCFSARCVSCSATIAVITFHIVFSRAIGLYAFGRSYLGLPGLHSTIVMNDFHGLNIRLSSRIHIYMCISLHVSISTHFVSTMFGIPSRPGALYGFNLLS